MTTIYTLELENGKYYIGRSNQPKKRILTHFNENGSEWTKLYSPIRVISEIKGDDFDEDKYTLIAMNKYGIDNVRGGSYCKTKFSPYEKEKAAQTINSIMDKCYKCGKKGHFSNECSQKDEDSVNREKRGAVPAREFVEKEICPACFGSGRSYWSDDVYGSCLECCCINCDKFRDNCTCYHNCDDIRKKLGQTLFPTPRKPKKCECHFCEDCEDCDGDCERHLTYGDKEPKCQSCENCIYRKWYSEVWKENGHLRFDFDAQQDFQQNKKIIELFQDLFEGKKVVLHAIKGGITAYVILDSHYEQSYWESNNKKLLRYEKKYEYCGEGTVEIIQDIIYQMRTV
jgi:hypothetical protein